MVSFKAEMEIQLLPKDVLVPKENGFIVGGRLVKAGAVEFTLTDGGVMRNPDFPAMVFHPGSKIKVENGVLTMTGKDDKKSWSFENAELMISGPKEGGTPVAGGAIKTPAPTARGAWTAGTPKPKAGAGGSKPKAGAGGSKPKAGAGGKGWETATDTRRRGAATGGGRRDFVPKKYEIGETYGGKDCIDLHEKKRLEFVGVDTTLGNADPDNFWAQVTDETGTKFKKFYFTKDTMARFCEDVLGVKVPEGTFPFYVPREHYIEFRTIRQ